MATGAPADSFAETCAAIIAAQGWAPQSVVRMDSWSNATFCVGGNVYLKICRHHPGNFRKEQLILRTLCGRTDLVPKLLGTQEDRPVGDVQYTLLASLGSRSLRGCTDSPSVMRLGTTLHLLHRLTAEMDWGDQTEHLRWELALRQSRRTAALAAASGTDRETVVAFYDTVADLLCWKWSALVHGDWGYTQAIILADGRIGLVDWECASVGDPMRDLAMFPETMADLRACMDGYGALAEDELRRLVIWRLDALLHQIEDREGTASAQSVARLARTFRLLLSSGAGAAFELLLADG